MEWAGVRHLAKRDQNPVLPGAPVGSPSSWFLAALLCVFLQRFPGRLLRLSLVQQLLPVRWLLLFLAPFKT